MSGNPLIGPTVHLNGTSRDELMEQYLSALRALDGATAALPGLVFKCSTKSSSKAERARVGLRAAGIECTDVDQSDFDNRPENAALRAQFMSRKDTRP
jgi:hypothetical protein